MCSCISALRGGTSSSTRLELNTSLPLVRNRVRRVTVLGFTWRSKLDVVCCWLLLKWSIAESFGPPGSGPLEPNLVRGFSCSLALEEMELDGQPQCLAIFRARWQGREIYHNAAISLLKDGDEVVLRPCVACCPCVLFRCNARESLTH